MTKIVCLEDINAVCEMEAAGGNVTVSFKAGGLRLSAEVSAVEALIFAGRLVNVANAAVSAEIEPAGLCPTSDQP